MGGNKNKIKKIFAKNKTTFCYCISEYPTKLGRINWNKAKKYDGFSDHTEGFLAPIMFAINSRHSKKTKFYEKHVSIAESTGPDKSFSMHMNDFGQLISEFKKTKYL